MLMPWVMNFFSITIDAFGIMLDRSTLNPRGECKNVDINLRDANDLLPPLAAPLLYAEEVACEVQHMQNTRRVIE